MITAFDVYESATSRLISQYRDSPNLKAMIKIFTDEIQLVQDAAFQLERNRRISDAEGYALDGLGEILGIDRELSGVVPLDFFALHDGAGGPAGEGFGDENDASAGQRFRSINEQEAANRSLGDPELRRMLDSKIERNQTEATHEDIISAIRAVLPDEPLVQISRGAGSVTATVQRVLSAEEIALLNAKAGIRGQIPVIPRPVGVSLSVVGL